MAIDMPNREELKAKLLEMIRHGEEGEATTLYRETIRSYTLPGSPRQSDEAGFWREMHTAIERRWGTQGIRRIKAGAWSAAPASASARRPARYVVAIDDSGRKGIHPSLVRRCFVLGGVVLPAANLECLRHAWTVAHTGQEETKARNYSSGFGFDDRPKSAEALLSVEMGHWDALPVWIAFDKMEAGEDVTLPTKRGGRRIDVAKAMVFLASTLAVHLAHMKGEADAVLIDHMASEAEELPIQDEWRKARAQLKKPHQRALPETLTFVDSESTPEIQAADVLAGLIRVAHEEGRPIAPGLSRLLRKAERQRLFGFHLS